MKSLFKDYAFKHFPVLRIVGINNFALHWKIIKLQAQGTQADECKLFDKTNDTEQAETVKTEAE